MWTAKLIKTKCLIKKIPSDSSESNVVNIFTGKLHFLYLFLFNWCDNSICLVDAAGSHIQIRKFHQNMATENTSIEGFRGIVVNICLQWTQWIHQKTVFNRLFFSFNFRQIFHYPLDLGQYGLDFNVIDSGDIFNYSTT